MATDPLGAVTFGYGNGTTVSGSATPALAASKYTADGAIRIVVPRSAVGASVGSNLTDFLIRVRVESGTGSALTPDNAPDSLARTGSYTVKGNENCTVPQPDLAVGSGDLALSGLKGAGNQQVIAAVVHNAGSAAVSSVKVRFAVDGVQVGGDQTIGQIAPGGTGRTTVVWDTHGQNGTHTITVTADPANAIVEKDESNNVGARSAVVQGSKAALG